MVKVPRSIKALYKKGAEDMISSLGRDLTVVLEPFQVDCPNCIIDNVSGKSSNNFDTQFLRPVNVFPGTQSQSTVYPTPFNITTLPSGIQMDPDLIDPKILKTAICPVCRGSGVLTAPNNVCVKGMVTWNPKDERLDLSAGRAGIPIARIRTYKCNYSIIRDCKFIIVDGVKCALADNGLAIVKGLGADHLTQVYVVAVDSFDGSVTSNYNSDARISKNTIGVSSDQAPPSTPTIPPIIPGDDVW